MQIKKYNFDNSITLFNLGDIHRGNKAHDNNLFKKVVNYIKEHDNCYWLSTGDLLDVTIPSNKFFDFDGLKLESEYEYLISDLYDIRKKGLCIVGSNHHKRFERAVGMSLDKMLAKELGIDYLGHFGLINILCGKNSYVTALHHGIGRGRTRGSKSNNFERLANLAPCADLYLEGHTHTYDTWKTVNNYIDRKRNKTTKMLSTFVVTGHCLTWGDSYAAELKLEEQPKGFAMIELLGSSIGRAEDKKVKVDLFC